MKISAGLLNRRCVLLAPTAGVDASGGPTLTYADAGGRWCSRLRWAPTEAERDAQRQTAASVQLVLRLDAVTRTVTTKWRVTFDGQELQIIGLDAAPEDGSLIITGQQPTD